jgi:NDP-sugar pyrophosphorylase family protein
VFRRIASATPRTKSGPIGSFWRWKNCPNYYWKRSHTFFSYCTSICKGKTKFLWKFTKFPQIGPNVTIGEGAVIAEGVRIKNAIVLDKAEIRVRNF